MDRHSRNEIKKLKEKYRHFQPWIRNTVYYKHRLYFIAGNYNVLFSINVKNGDVSVEYVLPGEKIDSMNLGNLYGVGRFLIMAPFQASHLFIWDLEKKKELFANNYTNNTEWNGFAMATVIKQSVYLWPWRNKCPYKINLDTMSVEGMDFCIDCEKYQINFINSGWYEYGKTIFFVSYDTSSMIEFSLETETSRCYSLKIDGSKVISLIGIDDNIYLLSEDRKLILWNIEKKNIQKEICFSWTRDDLRQLCERVYDGDCIYFLSRDVEGDWGIRYNRTTGEIRTDSIENFWNLQIEAEEKIHYSSCDESGNLYLFSDNDNMYIVNLRNKEVQKIMLQVPYIDIRDLFWNYTVNNTQETIPETEYWDVYDLLKLSGTNFLGNKVQCGASIYKVIR